MSRSIFALGAMAVTVAIAVTASTAKPPPSAGPKGPELNRYSLAGGCYGLRSETLGRFVTKAGGAYSASAGAVGDAEPFRMQATTLGRYLFYGPSSDFMAAQGGGTVAAPEPSDAADWTVNEDGERSRSRTTSRAYSSPSQGTARSSRWA